MPSFGKAAAPCTAHFCWPNALWPLSIELVPLEPNSFPEERRDVMDCVLYLLDRQGRISPKSTTLSRSVANWLLEILSMTKLCQLKDFTRPLCTTIYKSILFALTVTVLMFLFDFFFTSLRSGITQVEGLTDIIFAICITPKSQIVGYEAMSLK